MAFDVLATHKEINLVRNNLLENLATIEPTTTASTDYDEDAYLVFNGYLYRTMEAITAGDTLDPGEGGNIARVDVASQFGSGSVELTQAEYDALSEDEKMDDVLYLITDSPDNYLDEVFGDFASVEYTDTASKAYAVGEYLVYDSKFYKVTAAIAQGDTIAAGTNVVQTTVGEEVNALDEQTKTIRLNSTSSMTAQQALEAAWVSDIPANAQPQRVYIPAMYGSLFGTLNRYAEGSISYGSGLLTRYDGTFYKATLNENTVGLKGIQNAISVVRTVATMTGTTINAHAGARLTFNVTPPSGKSLLAHVYAFCTGVANVFVFLDGYSTDNTAYGYVTNTGNSAVTLPSSFIVNLISLYA